MKETAAVPTKRTRRKFDPEFKREAVALWQSSGKPAQDIAQQLGIREAQLYGWKKAGVTATASGDVQAQLIALRQENALLRQQRDIVSDLRQSRRLERV